MSRKRSQARVVPRKRSQIKPVRPPRRYLNAFYDRADVVLVRRDEDDVVRFERMKAESSFFIREQDVDERLLRMIRVHPSVRAVKRNGSYWRISWCDRASCEEYSRAFEKRQIPTYEGAISPIRRIAADRDLSVDTPRRIYLDLETDSRVPFSRKEEMRILCWALVDGQTGKRYSGALEDDTNEAEANLLAELWGMLEPYDQVIAWNGNRFDFPVLRARSRLVNVNIDHRRWLWLTT